MNSTEKLKQKIIDNINQLEPFEIRELARDLGIIKR